MSSMKYGTVSAKDIKRMMLTMKIAQMSTLRYQIGASIYVGSKHVSSAFNVMKSHPDHKRFYNAWCVTIHAEHNSLLGAKTSVAYGTIYVVRFKGETSKPCEGCLKLITLAGIQSMVYTYDGQFVKEYI